MKPGFLSLPPLAVSFNRGAPELGLAAPGARLVSARSLLRAELTPAVAFIPQSAQPHRDLPQISVPHSSLRSALRRDRRSCHRARSCHRRHPWLAYQDALKS